MRWTAADPRTDAPLRRSKLDLARQLAGALAYIGLANLDRVNIHFFSESLGGELGLGRGKSHFHRALPFLDRLPGEGGQTNLARSLRAFGQKTKRRGLALILSDFFDPRGYEEALSYLLYQRFRNPVDPAPRPGRTQPAPARRPAPDRCRDGSGVRGDGERRLAARVRTRDHGISGWVGKVLPATPDRLPARDDGRGVSRISCCGCCAAAEGWWREIETC